MINDNMPPRYQAVLEHRSCDEGASIPGGFTWVNGQPVKDKKRRRKK